MLNALEIDEGGPPTSPHVHVCTLIPAKSAFKCMSRFADVETANGMQAHRFITVTLKDYWTTAKLEKPKNKKIKGMDKF